MNQIKSETAFLSYVDCRKQPSKHAGNFFTGSLKAPLGIKDLNKKYTFFFFLLFLTRDRATDLSSVL